MRNCLVRRVITSPANFVAAALTGTSLTALPQTPNWLREILLLRGNTGGGEDRERERRRGEGRGDGPLTKIPGSAPNMGHVGWCGAMLASVGRQGRH